jgi:hypothetical protein
MNGFLDVLSGVKMSTASAADGVVESCRAQGLRIRETEPTFDIDEASDLEFLIQVLGDDPELCPVTRATLADLGLT